MLKTSNDHHEIRNTEVRKCKLICFGGRKAICEGLRGMNECVLLTSRDTQAHVLVVICALTDSWFQINVGEIGEEINKPRLIGSG